MVQKKFINLEENKLLQKPGLLLKHKGVNPGKQRHLMVERQTSLVWFHTDTDFYINQLDSFPLLIFPQSLN